MIKKKTSEEIIDMLMKKVNHAIATSNCTFVVVELPPSEFETHNEAYGEVYKKLYPIFDIIYYKYGFGEDPDQIAFLLKVNDTSNNRTTTIDVHGNIQTSVQTDGGIAW